MRVRAVLAFALVAAPGAASALVSCFPDYAIGGAAGADAGHDGTTGEGGGSSGGDGASGEGATGDGATGEGSAGEGGTKDGGGGDGTVPDGGPGSDGASGSDGSAGNDAADAGTTGSDGGVVDTVSTIASGTFAFQVKTSGGSVVDASATLDYALAVDRDEVTVGKFQAWVSAGMPIPAGGQTLDAHYLGMTWQSPAWDTAGQDANYGNASVCNTPGGKGPTYGKGDPGLPMNCVTWEQALAFCWWDHHRRLPTDTEWRVVATSEGRRAPYPWGAPALACSLAVYDDGTNYCGWPVDAGSASAGQTLDQVQDIVGSLSEWLWDYVPGNYAFPADAGTDYGGPSFPGGANHRIWIGGDWTTNDTSLFQVDQAAPTDSSPEENFDNTGWRCVSSQ